MVTRILPSTVHLVIIKSDALKLITKSYHCLHAIVLEGGRSVGNEFEKGPSQWRNHLDQTHLFPRARGKWQRELKSRGIIRGAREGKRGTWSVTVVMIDPMTTAAEKTDTVYIVSVRRDFKFK